MEHFFHAEHYAEAAAYFPMVAAFFALLRARVSGIIQKWRQREHEAE